jgi:metal-sulfur cluster biosynthetic enzyme
MPTEKQVLAALERVIVPELGVDVVNLGLVYSVDFVEETGTALVTMTLPALGSVQGNDLLAAASRALLTVRGIRKARVNLAWFPPWEPGMVTRKGRSLLEAAATTMASRAPALRQAGRLED